MRILLIEDDRALRELLTKQLTDAGFQIDASGDGQEGLYLSREYPFDAAIIDLGLPGLPGLEIIRRLRAEGRLLPILVLTARSRWQDKVEGLEAGADDYLAKPFEPAELLARLRALLRRAAASASREIRCGPLRLDLDAQRVSVEERTVALTEYEYRLFEHLMMQRHRVVSKQELTDHLYAQDDERDSNVVEVLIGRLRRKLDPDNRLNPILTLRGRGYRLNGGEPVS